MPSMNLGRYLEVLRVPGVARVAAFATIGRLPFAIVPLSIVLLMRQEGYHYGQIGAVVAAESLAVGLTAGFVGRLVDRMGRRRVILATGATTTLFVCAETLAILSGAPVWLLVVAGSAPGRHDPSDLGVDALALGAAGARGDASRAPTPSTPSSSSSSSWSAR